jgi:thioredoxin reductase (NADPH)
MEPKIYPVCVIGGGSAGIMAVLRTVLNNDECLFFPGSPKDKKRSRAFWVRKIENMPAHLQYQRGIEEPNTETLKWISESPFKNNLYIQKNTGVIKIEKNSAGVFVITDSKNQKHFAEYAVLCTGVMDVQPNIQGSIEKVFDYANAQTIDYCLICDGHHTLGKPTAVIGHTISAAWVAIMLHERYRLPMITILTNSEKMQLDDEVQKILALYNIKIKEQPILEILGSEKGKVLEGFQFANGEKLLAEICFVSLGMIVYNELAKQLKADLDERGFVKANELGQTSVEGLYVAGDLKANTKKQIYTAWDSAVTAVNAINQKLRAGKRKKLLT